jgi:ammonia channel protein AmtB
MQTGLALLEVGIVGSKNRVNVMMKNIVDMTMGGFCYWAVGFGLMYGRGAFSNGLFGVGDFFLDIKVTDPLMAPIFTWYFYQMSFCTTSASIVSGAIAERCKFSAYMLISFMMTFIYAIGGGWLWGNHGWLKNIGVIEFSGAGPVHIIGGACCE